MTSEIPSRTRGGSFCFLPISRLRATYAVLRSATVILPNDDLSVLPLRVAAGGNHFEIIDGFKRFEAWKAAGLTEIPVVIEHACSVPERKKLLLQANRTRSTISPLDEASVAASMIEEDGLSVSAVSKLLGRKRACVMQRRALLDGLSEMAANWVGAGKLRPSLAFHLTSLEFSEQDRILQTFQEHTLKHSEQLALIEGYRVADARDRQELLTNPLGILRPPPSTFTIRFQEIEHQWHEMARTMKSARPGSIPDDLSPAEKRRLEALAQAVRERASEWIKARPVSRDHRGKGRSAPEHHADSSGDSRTGLQGGPDNSGRACQQAQKPADAATPKESQTPFRDASGGRDADRLVAGSGTDQRESGADPRAGTPDVPLPEGVLRNLP